MYEQVGESVMIVIGVTNLSQQNSPTLVSMSPTETRQNPELVAPKESVGNGAGKTSFDISYDNETTT